MIYKSFTNFLKDRTIELLGVSLIFSALLLTVSFFSYSPSDPTIVIGSDNVDINNLLGIYGGIVADFLLQSFGLTSFLISITLISWGFNLIFKKKIKKIKYKIFYLFLYVIFTCILISFHCLLVLIFSI
jgi:S-DNA-T family DNA segregation ATPase FtsK/SpoIIIE